jgi:hypothetical protein
MTDSKGTDHPYIIEIDIAGESLVLGINNVKDSLKMFDILAKNGYHVTISALSTASLNKEKTDEEHH